MHFQHKVRTETMVTFGKLCSGLGTAAASVHRDVYKTVRAAMSDRVMPVREAGAFCLLSMAPYAQASSVMGNQVSRLWEKGTRQHLPQLQFITTTELESVATMCFRSFDGANYETRKAIAKTLGNILAMTQQTVR